MFDAKTIGIAISDLIASAILFLPAIWIAWKHGKKGLICWPIFVSYFVLRFTSDIYQIVHRNESPQTGKTVIIMASSGSIACLSLTLLGIVYEVNTMLPLPPKRWIEKIILGIAHLISTIGIGLATYGGEPKTDASGGVVGEDLNKIGNCLMVFVMFLLGWWMWQTWQRVIAVPNHPNWKPARAMLIATGVALPFQLVRITYNTTYAFNRVPALDPVTGSFATRLVLIFGTQLGATLAIFAGGWLGMRAVPKSLVPTAEEDMSIREGREGGEV